MTITTTQLTSEREQAVARVVATMDTEALVGQLMCVYDFGPDASALLGDLEQIGLRPGGVLMSAMRTTTRARTDIARMQAAGPVPLLIAANLEAGTATTLTDGDALANPMQVAATGDPAHAALLGRHVAALALQTGINWAFAPVVDLPINHHNPIIATRAFGTDPGLTGKMGAEYVRAVQAAGVAAAPKHWPGDGVDDRDQHLLTSVNTLSMPQWRETFGRVYEQVLAAGPLTLMAGHIALPAYDDSYAPASLSRKLLTDLLRGEFGYDGMVVSDNNLMAGFTRVMTRRDALAAAVNAGNDMLLGARYVAEDYADLLAAVESGQIPPERLREAVTRTLRVKAALGLFDPAPTAPEPVDPVALDRWKSDLAAASVTLTKQTDDILPVTATRYPRVLVYVLGDTGTFYEPAHGTAEVFIAGLRERGHQVTRRDIPGEGRNQVTEREIQREHDLIVYFANNPFDSVSNTSRLRWSYPQGAEVPRLPESRSLLISVADPYHLQDLPSIGTAINGYTPSAQTVQAVLAAVAGAAPFLGASPVDQFGGYPDARR